ncbi:MAG: YHS domain-containing protein [Planctomycetes bacterium]|nr:YHS domain-containing protein [Planctomycetota bacterium]
MRPLLVALFASTALAQANPPAERVDFVKQVAPVLLERCIDCHGPEKQKGDLRLDQRVLAFAGETPSLVAGKPDESEFLRRLALPADDDEVMPQKGEPLSAEQQATLRRWVTEGADWPAAGDDWLRERLAAAQMPKTTFELPPLDEAARARLDAEVARLTRLGALVQVVAKDTEALQANLSLLGARLDDATLRGIEALAPRLVWLDLGRTAIGDASAPELAKLAQLRRLQVANTGLGDAAFAALQELRRLETVNAVGTKLGDRGLLALARSAGLRRVYAWQSQVTPAGKGAAVERSPNLVVDLGDYAEARLAAASREANEAKERGKPVNVTCPVADKPVDPQHTVEHEGRRIGFCCGKCKAAFLADPGKFAGKLPAK